ncbi:OpgC family protein [Tropicimonas sp.]|uniref:OpgC family protein n=1 Tax=Tropicimonas sp. TaxID=2067044 RepID=UPI003A8973E3
MQRPVLDPGTPGAAPPRARRPRDPRIDAFRGLALVVILIDHIPGNPYEHFTIRNFGFSDAAEAFFLMSGVAAGIAYSGRFLPAERAANGLVPAVLPMWKRAWTLYIVHLFLSAWAIAIFVAGRRIFDMPSLLTLNNLRAVFNKTEAALFGIPALTHQIGYVNILPAYSALLFFAPLAIMIGLRRPWLMMAISIAIWFFCGMWRINFPSYPNTGGWFFNPLTWQIIFVTGLLTGMAARRGERFVPKSRGVFAVTLGFLILSFAWRHIPPLGDFLNHQLARLGAIGVPFNIVSHDKPYVALPRLLHILSLAYVLSCLGWVHAAAGSRLMAPLRLLGRHGLLVFSTGTLVSLVFQVLMNAGDRAPWLGLTLPPAGIAVMFVAAWLAASPAERAEFGGRDTGTDASGAAQPRRGIATSGIAGGER